MGRGPGSKGKTSKQAGVLGGAGANEPIDVSVETQPRHFTYVGKLDGSSEAAKGGKAPAKGKTPAGKDGAGKGGFKGTGKAPAGKDGKDGPKGGGKDVPGCW